MAKNIDWWAKGLMFENCNCRLVCRCHISYRQPADHDRCIGCFAIDVAEGRYGDIRLDGARAFIAVDAPRQMLEGGWTMALIIDDRADENQRQAMSAILNGEAEGTWSVLGNLVARRLPVRYATINFENEGSRKRMWADGLFDTSHEAIKGADKHNAVRLENIHNQVHGSSQILALGATTFETEGFAIETAGTHAICSEFSWHGP